MTIWKCVCLFKSRCGRGPHLWISNSLCVLSPILYFIKWSCCSK